MHRINSPNIVEEETPPAAGTAPTEPQGPPPPKPGTEEWVYVQEPIDLVRMKFVLRRPFFSNY